jgi:phosphoribosylanthranilate isomerase
LRQDFVVIKAFSIAMVEDLAKLDAYEGVVDYFLFDTKTPGYGGSGQKFDWQILQSARIKTPFLLSGGISLDDIPTIKSLKINNLIGVDLNSKFETAPAMKDVKKLTEFLDTIKL